MLMEILIDNEKCKVPMGCRQCVRVCPQCVFQLHLKRFERFLEMPLEDWELRVYFPDMCSGCMECVKDCPLHAIKVRPAKVQKGEVASAT